jgi:VWFA-related protein
VQSSGPADLQHDHNKREASRMPAIARRAVATASLYLLLSSASIATAQQTPMRTGETIDVSIVNVEVFVTDKKGNRVRGLRSEDFTIFENDKEQPISNFAEYAGNDAHVAVSIEPGAVGEPQAQAETPAREKRTLLVFFERSHLPAYAIDPIVASLKQAVRTIVGPDDVVSFIAWDRNVTAHVGFTSDISKVDQALDRVAAEATGVTVDGGSQRRHESEAIERMNARAAAMARGAMRAPQTGSSDTNAAMEMELVLAYSEMKKRVAAINSALTTLAGVEGKKILILATRSLGEVAGADVLYSLGYTQIPWELKQRFGTAQLTEKIVENANASGVTIYPIYPRGMDVTNVDADSENPPPVSADILTYQNEVYSLREVARKTGGLTAAGFQEVAKLMPRVSSDLSDYYSLAYRANGVGADRPRNVVVKTRNRDLVVRARQQVVQKSDDRLMRERVVSTLFYENQRSPIAIHAQTQPRKRGTVHVQVRVPIGALTMLPQADGRYAGSFSVFVGSAADLDELSKVTHKTQPFEIAEKDLARAKSSYFTYELDVNVGTTAKYVAIGVYDEVGKTYGLERVDLEGK